MRAATLENLLYRAVMRQPDLIDTGADQGVVHVGHGHQARESRNRIARNPLEKVPEVDIRGRQTKRRASTEPELQRLLTITTPKRRLIYLTAIYTGLVGEWAAEQQRVLEQVAALSDRLVVMSALW